MIIGAHMLIYAKDAKKARAFFRDVLDFPHVDAGEGWLIFALPPSEVGVHPEMEGSGSHEIHLMCDDVRRTRQALEAKGVKFTQPIADRGYGLFTALQIPGGGELSIYEPRHPLAREAVKAPRAKKPAAQSKAARRKKPVRAKARKRR